MKVEVLVSTMNQSSDDYSLIERMNISGNCIVCNQTSFEGVVDISNEHRRVIYSHNETGVGKSRNTLILRSKADICILADDDLVFKDDYELLVVNEFKKNPDADVIIFNLKDEEKKRFSQTTSINYINYTKFGAARFAFRRKAICDNKIFFNLLFGGGTIYGSGEDSLFLNECLRKGLKIVGVNESLAKLEDLRPSSWFVGYNEKYYFDKGALFYALGSKIFYLQALQYALRKYKLSDGKLGFVEVLKLMINGKNAYKKALSYDEYLVR